jgi:anti-sigma regulatory factor (Ser/Thr protein kinase)
MRVTVETICTSSISFHLRDTSGLVGMRRWLRAWLGEIGVERWEYEEIVLACWEATLEALERPSDESRSVELAAEWIEGHVLLCITDHGPWLSTPVEALSSGLSTIIIEAMVDHVQVLHGVAATRVLMCRCLHTDDACRAD